MRDRDDILALLLEPYGTLSDEERSQAEELALRDPEVALALRDCRAMAGLTASAVFGESSVQDAVFLTQVRQRIEQAAAPQTPRGLFGSFRLVSVAAAACVALMVIVLGYHTTGISPVTVFDATESTFASALESAGVVEYDSLIAEAVSPESLAVYLGMPEMAENWDFDDTSEAPLSDELLALDEQSLEEVMVYLEAMEFF